LHQVGVSFDLYYDARKHKIKTVKVLKMKFYDITNSETQIYTMCFKAKFI